MDMCFHSQPPDWNDMMDVKDPFMVEGPCACPGCYVNGCDYCHYLGCCRHLDGTPYFVPPIGTLPVIKLKNPFA